MQRIQFDEKQKVPMDLEHAKQKVHIIEKFTVCHLTVKRQTQLDRVADLIAMRQATD